MSYYSQKPSRAQHVYVPGDHNIKCDRCGNWYRISQTRQEQLFGTDTWRVCTWCFEEQNPQDFLRAIEEHITPDVVRPKNEALGAACKTRSAIAKQAIAGCAIAGVNNGFYGVPF